MDNQNLKTLTQDDFIKMIGLLERMEEARQVLENIETIDKTVMNLKELEIRWRRFCSMAELSDHLLFIEKNIHHLKEYLTISEAADYLSRSQSQIYKMTQRRDIPIYKPNGKTVFIRRDDLNRWIAKSKLMSRE